MATDPTGGVDKAWLYGNFDAFEKRKQNTYMKAVNKALDLPDDEMNITANKSGLGTAGAVGISAVIGAVAVVGMWIVSQQKPTVPTAQPPANINTLQGFKLQLEPTEIDQAKPKAPAFVPDQTKTQ